MNSDHASVERSGGWRRWLPRVIRLVIALLVVLGVGRRLWSERERLAPVVHQVQFSWLVLAAMAYVAGLSTCALFWWWSIRDQGNRPSFLATWTAYFAGHLGKYVPGKGLVVVIRAGLLRESGVSLATGAVSCVHETLLMMAAGSFVALLFLPVAGVPHRATLLVAAVLMFLGLMVPSLPPAVAFWSRWVTRPFLVPMAVLSYQSRWSTFGAGFAVIALGWFLMGLSLAAVLQSMQGWSMLVDRWGVLDSLGLLTAAVALATVGGFLSFLPGGLGSREWILVETLGPALGLERTADAALAALLLRVVWILAELAGTALFWLLDRPWKNRRAVTH